MHWKVIRNFTKSRCTQLFAWACGVAMVLTAPSASAEDLSATLAQEIRSALAVERFTVERIALERTALEQTESLDASLFASESLPETLEVDLVYQGRTVTLDLERRSLRSDNFQLLVQGADGTLNEIAPPPVRTYRGTAEVTDGSETRRGVLVAASLFPEGLSATVLDARGAWSVLPLRYFDPTADAELHVFYDAADVKTPACGCGEIPGFATSFASGHDGEEPDVTSLDVSEAESAGDGDGRVAGLPAEDCTIHVAQLAYDSDFEFFTRTCDSDTDTCTTVVEDGLNTTNVIYIRDLNVVHHLSSLVLRTDPETDFYAQWPDASDFGDMLSSFRSEWNNNMGHIEYDMAYLLTRKSSPEYGGLAYVGVVCSSSRYGMGIGSVGYAGIMRHELGHNWGASHDCGAERRYIMCGNSISAISAHNIGVMGRHRDGRSCLDIEPHEHPDSAPYARPDFGFAQVGEGAHIRALEGDSDANCDTLRLESFDRRSAAGGVIELADDVDEDGFQSFIYTPTSPFVGTDSFGYTVADGTGNTATSRVFVNVVPQGLVAYYRLDEVEDEEAEDSSGFDHEGELQGDAVFENVATTGRLGGAVLLPGDSDIYVRVDPDPRLDLRRGLTVAAWFRVDGFAADGGEALVSKGSSAWRLKRDGSRNTLKFTCSGVSDGEARGSTAVNDGEWHHAVGVYTGEEIALYIDGELDASRPAFGLVNRTSSSMRIGYDGWNGAIDEVRVYNYGMAASDVQALFEAGRVDNPDPADGMIASGNPTLQWVGFPGAAAYDVYLGTERNAVAAARSGDAEHLGQQASTDRRVSLEEGQRYFWRVDAIVDGEARPGDVWSFFTSFAYTNFDEPPTNASNYSPGPGDRELGFTTASTPSGGDDPFTGVIGTGSTPTTPIFSHRSVNARTTFDAVDLTPAARPFVSFILQARSTGYEEEDSIDIYATDGAERVDVLGPMDGRALSQLAGKGYSFYGVSLPPSWETAQLVMETSSNSSSASERYDLDSVTFSCVASYPLIAQTSFAEAAVGAADYTPGAGAQEIGFATVSTPTSGADSFVGVSELSAPQPGVTESARSLVHRSVSAVTTFDAIDLSRVGDVTLRVVLRVRETSYEDSDLLEIYADNGAGERLDMLAVNGSSLAGFGDDDYETLTVTLPASWNEATVVVRSRSDSSAGAEQLDLHSIAFYGASLDASCGDEPPAEPRFQRGDANSDGNLDLSDGVRILNFLFLGGDAGGCLDAADADDSGGVELTDGIRVFNFLFLGGAPLPDPGSGACGVDPTADTLECLSFPSCE